MPILIISGFGFFTNIVADSEKNDMEETEDCQCKLKDGEYHKYIADAYDFKYKVEIRISKSSRLGHLNCEYYYGPTANSRDCIATYSFTNNKDLLHCISKKGDELKQTEHDRHIPYYRALCYDAFNDAVDKKIITGY